MFLKSCTICALSSCYVTSTKDIGDFERISDTPNYRFWATRCFKIFKEGHGDKVTNDNVTILHELVMKVVDLALCYNNFC